MLRKNPNLKDLQVSGSANAVDDTSMRLIADLTKLTFLDISYSKKLTDKGCNSFFEKTSAL